MKRCILIFCAFTLCSAAVAQTVLSNVTLKYVDPTGAYQYPIQETSVFQPGEFPNPTLWTDVTNATTTVNGNMVTAEFPQSPGPQRFYRLASK